jgi:unsaturated rhamnogalacturonyl hydrolase
MRLQNLVTQVTQFTVNNPSERDCWEKAPAMTAVLTWGEKDFVAVISRWLDRAVATQKSDGNFSYTDGSKNMLCHLKSQTPTVSLSSTVDSPLLMRYRESGNEADLEAVAKQIEGLKNLPRAAKGSIWARCEAPELWINYLYLTYPFIVLYGQITKDNSIIDDAFRRFDVHVKYLIDQHKHLPRHAWCEKPDHFPQSTFWLRDNSWLVCACVDLVTLIPLHPGIDNVRMVCAQALTAVEKYQDRSGYFFNVLYDPESNFEALGTVMYAYAVAEAIEHRIVRESIFEFALRAFKGVAGGVGSSGKVPGATLAPGGPDVPRDWTLFSLQSEFFPTGAACAERPLARHILIGATDDTG